jgi:ribosomal protein S18 acetylase RimI-like enzyme
VLPEGKSNYDDKFVLGVSGTGEALDGVVDIIRDEPVAGEWNVGLFLLAPDVRRRGLGTALWREVRKWARERGARLIRAGVAEWNEPGVSFVRSLGLRDETVVDDYRAYSRRGRLLVMVDELGD